MRRTGILLSSVTTIALCVQATGSFAATEVAQEPTTAAPDTVLSAIEEAVEDQGISTNAPPSDATSVDLPETGSQDAEAVGDTGTLTMGIPADGADLSDGDAHTSLFEGDSPEASIAVQSTEDGMRALIHIASASAPERYEFPIGGDVTELVPLANGEVEALNAEGEVVATAATPWATDANGVDVPTRYEIDGTRLTQVVEHRSGNFTYGIVADPSFWWAVKCGGQIALFLAENNAFGKVFKALKSGAKTFAKLLKSKGSKTKAVKWLVYELSGAKGATTLVEKCWPD